MSRYDSSSGSFMILYTVLIVCSIVFGCGRGVLVDERRAVYTLETQGYTDVQITDKSWFVIGWRGCDQNDAARFTARTKNPAGKMVTMYVCSGLIKGGTIRTP